MKLLKDKKILVISSEVVPYLPQTEKAVNSFSVSRKINDNGGMTRIFMPKYGMINERRHQLHEVIRLSGMNMIINDLYMPLIIKVASIPKERMQVYFIDNEDYFKRKATFADEEGNFFKDNDERAIFFAKGVVETVKKLNWVPDVIHVHGWMASLLPLYLKHFYKNEGIFAETKIVTSVYGSGYEGELDGNLIDKVCFDNVSKDDAKFLEKPSYENLMKLTIDHSDAVIVGSEELPSDLTKYIESSGKPFLPFANKEEVQEKYTSFLKNQVL